MALVDIKLDALDLPVDLVWEDEAQWSPVMQDVQYSATGALLMQESEKQSGRPITLVGMQDMCWISRTTLESLIIKKNTKGLRMSLTINSVERTVMFRHSEGGEVSSATVNHSIDFNLGNKSFGPFQGSPVTINSFISELSKAKGRA